MGISVDALQNFINIKFFGDYKTFAKALEINSVTLWRILNYKTNAGEKFLTSLMLYCKRNGLEFDIFFIQTVA
ncbi:MAG TPA: XRE family transcriptional regulator [Patescibacteria group bacterium]|nr:XRE family transcriptional regulator [Patescibacteria group bacterium]